VSTDVRRCPIRLDHNGFGTSANISERGRTSTRLAYEFAYGPSGCPASQLPRLLQSRIPTARSCPRRAGRRRISRAHVLIRKPHTRRWQRLIWAPERRQDVQPPAILAHEVVTTRTTTPDGAVNARVGVCHRRDAEKARDDHGGHRDDDRPHNRLTLVQAACPVNRMAEPRKVTRNAATIALA